MTIVEIDGVYTQPRTVDTLYIAVAQRYGVLLTTKTSTTKNYAGLAKLDEMLYDGYNTTSYTAQVKTNANANLIYASTAPTPVPLIPTLDTLASQVIDDFTLAPYDKQPLLQNPTQQFVMEIDFFSQDGQNRSENTPLPVIPLLTTTGLALTTSHGFPRKCLLFSQL